jgi:ATP-dependent RNA helicase DeaD
LPDEIETYTHRSGRTGRAGKTGVSMVIVSKSEVRKISSIEKKIQQKFEKKEIPSGDEICEMQLFHLANNIAKTEINHEIDAYLPKLNEALADFSKEELIKKFFSVEFTRFNNYYKKSKDLNIEGGKSSYEEDQKDSTRFFINVGSKDDFDWMTLKDFLRDLLQLGKDDVYKVDVKESFSFFNTDDTHQELVLSVFTDFQLEGRRVSVEISKDTGRRGRSGGGKGRSGGGNRDSRGGGRDRNRSRGTDSRSGGERDRGTGDKGGFKKRSSGSSSSSVGDKPKFSGKRRGRTDKPDSAGTGGKRRRRS